MFRIGIGHDMHPLATARPFILGGVRIESDLGAAGHSDADTLAHAVADAILGALGEGDLGSHFPDTDPQWKDADSLDLLARVNSLAGERGFRIINLDSNIMLERPRLRDYLPSIRNNLAETLGLEISCISVKAKTGEGLDAVGRGEAVVAQAIVLLESISRGSSPD